MPQVSVVIVCMNRPDILFPCLDSIKAGNFSAVLETLVVAYRFSPENLARLMEFYPWVKVVPSDGIRGFSENNNLALRQAQGRYCLILNDDTLVPAFSIDRLVLDMETLPDDAAAVSPRIEFADGRVQTLGRAPWSPWRYFLHYMHLVDETHPTKWSMKSGLFRTFTLNGACFLIKTDVFREAGFFDERFFFTPEDIALGHLLNSRGYSVYADADISITHLAGGSVSQMEPAIKPARVQGALLFYSGGSAIKRFFLALFVWLVEAARGLKYLFADKSDPASHASIMSATARNVRRNVFTSKTPKQVFLSCSIF